MHARYYWPFLAEGHHKTDGGSGRCWVGSRCCRPPTGMRERDGRLNRVSGIPLPCGGRVKERCCKNDGMSGQFSTVLARDLRTGKARSV